MGIFPTRILLAADGSEKAELAALRAVELAQSTGSELHMVHVGLVAKLLTSDPATCTYDRKLYEDLEEESRELLRKLSWRVKVAGGTVAGTHLKMGTVDLEIVGLVKEIRAGLIMLGCRVHRGIRRVIEGEYLRGGYPSRPLPGPGGALARERRDP